MVEVHSAAAQRGAVEGAGQQAEHQRQAVALVPTLMSTQGQEHAILRFFRIGQRLALTVNHPALGHHFAALRFCFHLAVGSDGGGHIEYDGAFLETGHRDGDRVGRQKHVYAAPGRHVVGIAHRKVEADHVVRQGHGRVQRGRPGVVAVVYADPGDARCFGFGDGRFGGELHHYMAHAVVTVDQRHAGHFTFDAHLGCDVHRAGLDAAHVLRQAENTVAVGAVKVGPRH